MADNDNRPVDSLVTERDIDPKFGMFSDRKEAEAVPTAEQELLETYAQPSMLSEQDTNAAEAGELPDIPDADEISANSPVDPAAPPDQFHGTDLLNGVGNDPEEETETET